MELQLPEPVSMLRYVLGYFAAKLAAAGALVLYSIYIADEPPVSSMAITIIAVSVSVGWFANAMKRQMLRSERMWLAIGNTAAEVVLTIFVVLTMFWLAGASYDWEGLSQVIVGKTDNGFLKFALIFGMIVGLLQTAFLSVIIAWFWTKNLPVTLVVDD